MKAAIIGLGNIANTHASALKALGIALGAVIGTSEEKARLFAEKWGAERSGIDLDLALQDDITVVHICTPPALHSQMAKAALLAGKHVICEKPMSLTAIEAKELYDLAKSHGKVAAVNFNVRYHNACQRAREEISNGALGDIFLVHGSYLQEFHIPPTEYMWRYDPSLGGPMRATTEIGSHFIDLTRFLTSLEIERVSAVFGNFHPKRYLDNGRMVLAAKPGRKEIKVTSEDAAIITFSLSNGALGSMVLSEISHGRSNRLSIEITGQERSLWWCSENPYTYCTGEKPNGISTHVDAFGHGFPGTFQNFFEAVYEDIQRGIVSEAPDYPTFWDGYQNASVCSAIYKSSVNDGKWVRV